MKDQELDKYLATLRAAEPHAADVERWQAAIRREFGADRRSKPRWMEWAVAGLIGVILGASLFGHSNPPPDENSANDATLELVVTKLN